MLFSIVLKLRPVQSFCLSPTQGYYGHALFLSLIEKATPQLATLLHSDMPYKPFTVSPLYGGMKRHKDSVTISPHEVYQLRFTLLDDLLFSPLVRSLAEQEEREIYLEKAAFKIEDILLSSFDSSLTGVDSFNDLLQRATPQTKIALEFLSPVTFRSAKGRNILLPLPELVFGSYLEKWNAFSPLKIDLSRQILGEKMTLSKYHLKTKVLEFKTHREIGFEGRCTFEAEDEEGEEELKKINALADFAFYSGTGAKTTMGMGQTRRI
ncbi:CRISPR-associated endoribonuclease Cas6 [candidate division NPL-UPA2 bacterium]|nr:CRISPR-associated endoribonuclease Cas6 [candidate division NPL-UPA2 bacterium]